MKIIITLSLLLASVPAAGADTVADLMCKSIRRAEEAYGRALDGPLSDPARAVFSETVALLEKNPSCVVGEDVGAGVCAQVPAGRDPAVREHCCTVAMSALGVFEQWITRPEVLNDASFSVALFAANMISAADSAQKAVTLACPAENSLANVPGVSDLCKSYRVGGAVMNTLLSATLKGDGSTGLIEDGSVYTLSRMRAASTCQDGWLHLIPLDELCRKARSQSNSMSSVLELAPLFSLYEIPDSTVSSLKESISLAGKAVDQLCE